MTEKMKIGLLVLGGILGIALFVTINIYMIPKVVISKSEKILMQEAEEYLSEQLQTEDVYAEKLTTYKEGKAYSCKASVFVNANGKTYIVNATRNNVDDAWTIIDYQEEHVYE